ncbi:transcriptional regulator, IclR family [Nocardioidaceae bacterium Broad-1]|nr:transcriptional regulator, IclR family [Nocardioidaceae bacterium Broad-1]
MSPGGDAGGRQPHAVRSALSVLEEVARAGPGITAKQISAALGLPRATTYRLVNLLVQDEYLVRLPDLSGFALGHRVTLLASNAIPDRERETAEILRGMRARIRAGVHLASFRDGRLELVDVDPDFPLTAAALADPPEIGADPGAAALGLLPAPAPWSAMSSASVSRATDPSRRRSATAPACSWPVSRWRSRRRGSTTLPVSTPWSMTTSSGYGRC